MNTVSTIQQLQLLLLLSFISLLSSPKLTSASTLILKKPECNKQRQEAIDQDSIALNMFGTKRQYPTKREDVKKFCDETLQHIDNLDKFSKDCFPSELQNYAKIFVYGNKRSVKNFCSTKRKNARRTQKFLSIAPCLNRYLSQDKCLQQFLQNIRNLIPYQMNSDKIYYTCCYYVDLMKCFDNQMSKLSCANEQYQEEFTQFVRTLNNDFVNFSCGEYNEQTDRCDHMKPLSKFNKIDSKQLSPMKFNSFFFLSVAMFESIGSNTNSTGNGPKP